MLHINTQKKSFYGLGFSALWISCIAQDRNHGDAKMTRATKITFPMKWWAAMERCSKKELSQGNASDLINNSKISGTM